MRQCAYCQNILSSSGSPFRQPWDMILHETPSYVVVPTLGAFVEGWVLIVSKRHVPAMGALMLDELQELSRLMTEVRATMKSTYGSAAVFEHGPVCGGTPFGCGVDHAHLHVVPVHTRLVPLIEKQLGQAPQWRSMRGPEDLHEMHSAGVSYLYVVENGQDGGWASGILDAPSQFMRRVLANQLGIPNLYDYRKYPFRDTVISTVRRLKRADTTPTMAGFRA